MVNEILCPTPYRPFKRSLVDTDIKSLNSKKRTRRSSFLSISPSSLTETPIDTWLSTVPAANCFSTIQSIKRPATCPATLNIDRLRLIRPSLDEIKQTSQKRRLSYPGSDVWTKSGTSSNSRLNTFNSVYRSALHANNVTLDCSGRQIPEGLRTFVSGHILEQRKSPPLSDQVVSEVIDMADELSDNDKGSMENLLRTHMFPLKHSGIAGGGNSPWNSVALPNNPDSPYKLALPSPDAHLGYPAYPKSSWLDTDFIVISHPAMLSHSMPTRSNTFPFLMVEMESEAVGGTIHVAENRAASSGSHSVNALLWLLREAGTYDETSLTDRISFTIAMSHRQAVFYLHWYSEADQRHYMSFLDSYSSFSARDIRACNSTVKNIIDHGLGARRASIASALKALFPFPQQWK